MASRGWRYAAIASVLATSLLSAPRVEFDVVSVREVPHSKGKFRIQEPKLEMAGNRFTLTASLKGIIEGAYGLHDQQVFGPDWLDSNAFQIVAKAAPDSTEEQLRQMCQALLADRFGLTFHHEKKEALLYAILPGKDGPRLLSAGAADNNTSGKIKSKPNRIASSRASVLWLADALSRPLGRPVLDETGLAGEFRIALEWTPAGGDAQSAKYGKTKAENDYAPTIFTAIQEQLGLRLESRRGMVDVLVVDHAERRPIDN